MLETNNEMNVAVIEKMIEILKANNTIGIHPDVVNHLEKAISITEQYQFDMEGWIDRCLIPDDATAVFELFKQTCGAFQLELNKAIFLLDNDDWTEEGVDKVLSKTEQFIRKSKGYSYLSSCASIKSRDEESEVSWLQEYLCLTGDIYTKVKIDDINLFSFRSRVYGENVLFHEYLQQLHQDIKNGKVPKKIIRKDQPSRMQVAMYFYYLHQSGEAKSFNSYGPYKIAILKEIVAASGHLRSWKALQQDYRTISQATGEGYISRGNKWNLNDLQVVISMLAPYPKALKLAENDLSMAKEKSKKM